MNKSENNGIIKIDLHVHSHYSEDAIGSPKQIVRSIRKKGINGVAITDHNSIKGGLEGLKLKNEGVIVIPGVEISTLEGHLLAVGVKEDITRGLPLLETIEIIYEKGGVPIIPHLFRAMSGVKEKNLIKVASRINSIEVFNSCSLSKTNTKMERIAERYNLGGTGGSDSHEPEYAGYGYTTFDTTDLRIDTLLGEIEKKKTWGRGTTLPLYIRKKRMIKSIKQFFERGFKRI